MKHKKRKLIALLLAGILTASAIGVTAGATVSDETPEVTAEGESEKSRSEKKTADGTEKSRPEKKAIIEPEDTIGKEAAKDAALADAGIEPDGHVRAKYKEKDDETYYKVRFKADGSVYKYKIDAKTGEVIDKSVEAEESVGEKPIRKHASEKKTKAVQEQDT